MRRVFASVVVAVFVVAGLSAGSSTVMAGKKFQSVQAGSSWSKVVSPRGKKF